MKDVLLTWEFWNAHLFLFIIQGWGPAVVKGFGSDCLYDSVSLAVTSWWIRPPRKTLGVVCTDEGHTWGFNKLPSPEGVPASLPLLCMLRKHFFSHLQRERRKVSTKTNFLEAIFKEPSEQIHLNLSSSGEAYDDGHSNLMDQLH